MTKVFEKAVQLLGGVWQSGCDWHADGDEKLNSIAYDLDSIAFEMYKTMLVLIIMIAIMFLGTIVIELMHRVLGAAIDVQSAVRGLTVIDIFIGGCLK